MSAFSFRTHIDWVTYSGKYPTQAIPDSLKTAHSAMLSAQSILESDLGLYGVNLDKPSSAPFYLYCFTDDKNTLKVSLSDNLAQGYKVELLGKFFQGQSISDSDLIKKFQRSHITLTRFDFALDLFNSGVVVSDIFDDIRPSRDVVNQRQVSLINGVTGDTLAVGSRASQFYLRLYDKGAEQNTDLDWLRVELEIKHDASKQMVLVLDLIQRSACAKMLDMLDGHSSLITQTLFQIAKGTEKMTGKKRAVKSNTELWFEKTVSPSLLKLWKKDKEAFERVRIELIDLLMGVHYQD